LHLSISIMTATTTLISTETVSYDQRPKDQLGLANGINPALTIPETLKVQFELDSKNHLSMVGHNRQALDPTSPATQFYHQIIQCHLLR
jgi:hypothetical protein